MRTKGEDKRTTREKVEDCVVEAVSWIVFVGSLMLLCVCLSGCKTTYKGCCITEEYAYSVAKDTASRTHVIYSGYGNAEELIIEGPVFLETIEDDGCDTCDVVEKVVRRLSGAQKITVRKTEERKDSVVESETRAQTVQKSEAKMEKQTVKEKKRTNVAWLWLVLLGVVLLVACWESPAMRNWLREVLRKW